MVRRVFPELGWLAVCFLCFQTLLLTLSSAQSDIFTSIDQMTDLLLIEKSLIGSLRDYIKSEENKLEKMKKWADEMTYSSKVAMQDPGVYLQNPVNAFKVIKRLTTDWDEIVNLVLTDVTFEFTSDYSSQSFPEAEDQIGAARALIRLQGIYKLDPEMIATGKMPGSSPDPSQRYILTVSDCFHLGKVAFTDENYHYSMLWMAQALKQLDEGETTDTVDEVSILEHLSYSASKERDFKSAVEYTERLLKLEPDHQNATENLLDYKALMILNLAEDKQRKQREEKEEDKEINKYTPYPFVKIRYEALCRGEGLKMTPQIQRRLFCRYHDNNHPKYIIGPVKQEIEWDQPLIIRYHDIVTDEEIERMKKVTEPKLYRSGVDGPTKHASIVSQYRTSKSAMLLTSEYPAIGNFYQLIEDITSLDMDSAEDLKVGYYDFGGHYEPHWDFRDVFDGSDPYEELGTGNRIATWLTYMNDVTAGGDTVFPDIGVSVSPIKGSAVFWYNLFRSGQGDFRTRHAACPVLVGNKWVQNIWIHERRQEFRRRCSLNETD